jgi:hypothetical protein
MIKIPNVDAMYRDMIAGDAKLARGQVWCCGETMTIDSPEERAAPDQDLCSHFWWCEAISWYSDPVQRERCPTCINGRCREHFEMQPGVSPWNDGPLWFWAGQPEAKLT